jgi:hypothetical protein
MFLISDIHWSNKTKTGIGIALISYFHSDSCHLRKEISSCMTLLPLLQQKLSLTVTMKSYLKSISNIKPMFSKQLFKWWAFKYWQLFLIFLSKLFSWDVMSMKLLETIFIFLIKLISWNVSSSQRDKRLHERHFLLFSCTHDATTAFLQRR